LAEGVLLAAGPHATATAGALDDLLRRMHGHQRKKTPLLRRLRTWSVAAEAGPEAPWLDPEPEQG
jgi:pyruvate kinase